MGQYDRKRVRLSPTGDSLTQQHFTFHDGEKKDYSSQSSCINSISFNYLPIKLTGILHATIDRFSNVTVAITVNL